MALITDPTGRAPVDAQPVAPASNAPMVVSPSTASTPAVLAAPATPPVKPTPTYDSGPWIAGRMYSVVPSAPLATVGEDTDETWYAITRGRFVGVTNVQALDAAATLRVSGAAHKGYSTQAVALRAFNAALENNAVDVVL
ncbi:hypothetical protein C8F04DRAFT_1254242 [Mycena alexandri]|uniref:Uncharacterized protein n=1 Tax=Mycena alexandri TaxID=1745969 RepID=A0AAD6X9A0_9AGAR|nr:hypothetical protein C8F04DRAFT_1254242 [Mycena alexandri]